MNPDFPWQEGSVALVGSAQSLRNSDYGDEIDHHDWVIRLNQGVFAADDASSTGLRTDFVFITLTGGGGVKTAQFLWRTARKAAQTVVIMSPKSRSIFRVDMTKFFPSYPVTWHRDLHQRLGARPSTGAMAVDFLLRTMADTSTLDVYGFDFFRTPDIAHGRNRVVAHDPSIEEQYIRGVIPPAQFHESPIVRVSDDTESN